MTKISNISTKEKIVKEVKSLKDGEAFEYLKRYTAKDRLEEEMLNCVSGIDRLDRFLLLKLKMYRKENYFMKIKRDLEQVIKALNNLSEKELSKVYLEKSIKLLKLFPQDILEANEDDIKMVAKNVSELQKVTIAISML